MYQRFAILILSAALLVMSGAEAMTGHCAKMTAVDPAPTMSAHCAEMMGMDMPVEQTGDEVPMESGACCCVITSAPLLFEASYIATPMRAETIWSRPVNIAGVSLPSKVAIPPPRG